MKRWNSLDNGSRLSVPDVTLVVDYTRVVGSVVVGLVSVGSVVGVDVVLVDGVSSVGRVDSSGIVNEGTG